jgi:two-component system response regulator FixJ
MPDKGLVFVVEDDDPMRESLATVLRDAGYGVRAYSNAEEFISATAANGTGCVVSDIRMPGMDGLALLRRLRDGQKMWPVVLITGHGDIALAVAAMKAGAADFLEKPFDAESLLAAVDSALTAERRTNGKREAAEAARRRLEGLTPRECEVLERLVAGDSNKQVASQLSLSPRTVEFHRAHIMAKTGVKGLPELVRLFMEAGESA